ncbi:hypothetical protein OAN307_c12270 [Octadecabacter antarcticus 307]|uniref:Uncharacterized protein n=2 Tax=Octadecabacter TaxID=53945 RepID=M9R578_9RHOB|nr:hypothetical protein OAN307_c12270 [Octadecabacter antarcticus 307]
MRRSGTRDITLINRTRDMPFIAALFGIGAAAFIELDDLPAADQHRLLAAQKEPLIPVLKSGATKLRDRQRDALDDYSRAMWVR